MLEAAQHTGVKLPGLETVKKIYDKAHDSGKMISITQLLSRL